MKQSKGSKQLKAVRLSSPTGVRDVALGHKATAERAPRNMAKSDYTERGLDDNDFDDAKARRKRWGL
jgi:hypothetical protein